MLVGTRATENVHCACAMANGIIARLCRAQHCAMMNGMVALCQHLRRAVPW